MLTDFEEILQNKALTSLFQPIVDLRTGGILGYEGLIRGPENSAFHSPLALFATAKEHEKTHELERLCCEVHAQRFRDLALPGKLFLNSSPCLLRRESDSVTNTSDLMTLIHGNDTTDIVIELTEGDAIDDYQGLRCAAHDYRALGVQLAIDDLGDAFSSLTLWSELRPDYVKIDKYFVSGIGSDPLKLQFVRSICEIARQAQTIVIAEGIETASELIELRRLGVAYGQGYYLATPQQYPPLELRESLLPVFKSPFGASLSGPLTQMNQPVTVRRLLHKAPAVSEATATNVVYDRFQKDTDLDALVILRSGLPVGLLRRDKLFDRLARPFHRELYGNRPCIDMLGYSPLIVDRNTSLHDLSQLIADGPAHYMTDGFIITHDGQYLGVGSSFELMREISQLQLRAARYANPLTQLPGNVPINEHIDLLLGGQQPFAVCYGDLDHFKPFNDLYGYRKGDEVIQLTAALFLEHSEPELDFVGHVGGDDFIIIFRSSDWESRCRRILEKLPLAFRHVYRSEHLEQGGYVTENRQLVREFHPLISLSLGVLHVHPEHLYSGGLIAEMASAAKSRAKQLSSNSLFIDRSKPLEAQPSEAAEGFLLSKS